MLQPFWWRVNLKRTPACGNSLGKPQPTCQCIKLYILCSRHLRLGRRGHPTWCLESKWRGLVNPPKKTPTFAPNWLIQMAIVGHPKPFKVWAFPQTLATWQFPGAKRIANWWKLWQTPPCIWGVIAVKLSFSIVEWRFQKEFPMKVTALLRRMVILGGNPRRITPFFDPCLVKTLVRWLNQSFESFSTCANSIKLVPTASKSYSYTAIPHIFVIFLRRTSCQLSTPPSSFATLRTLRLPTQVSKT